MKENIKNDKRRGLGLTMEYRNKSKKMKRRKQGRKIRDKWKDSKRK